MKMTSFPVHTVEKIIIAFGLKDNKITPIDGEPTLKSLIKADNELRNASVRVSHCAGGNFGYLYLTELQVVYNTISNIPYVPPFNPGETPNFVNLFGNAMETAKIEWQHNRQAFDMHQNVNAALITVFKQALDPEIISNMETDTNILAVMDFITYLDQYMRTYGRADPLAVNRIKREMEVQWDMGSHYSSNTSANQ